MLGLYLGLYQPTLNVIDADHRGLCMKCLMACLSAWLEKRDGVKKKRMSKLVNIGYSIGKIKRKSNCC